MSDFYNFPVRSLHGEPIRLSNYAGQVVLVVNTASQCGYTPQYAGLEALYRKYEKDGLVVLAFPCNQFGNQEPGDADAIENACLVNYGITFPVSEKIEVNGPGAHPLFNWLTLQLPGLFGRKVKWNFTKFLIGRDGIPLHRYAPSTKPEKLEVPIRRALGL
jgi:glutathione peroxidase